MGILSRVLWTALAAGTLLLHADDSVLKGRLEHNRYVAPSGSYSISLPVQIELGGTVTDTAEVVTFQDDFRIHASVACFRLGSSQERERQTRGLRDYLVWFFRQHVQTQFDRRFPGATIDEARYLPEVLGGALIVYNSLPNGSMFMKQMALPDAGARPPPARRGNILFIEQKHLYVVSLELAKLQAEATSSPLVSAEEQREILREELLGMVGRITFETTSASAN